MSTATADLVPLFIAGRWQASKSDRTGPVYNPSTGQVIARTPFCTAAEVDAAVPGRRRRPARLGRDAGRRSRPLPVPLPRQARATLGRAGRSSSPASTARRWREARASVQRGVEMVEFACGIPSLLMGQVLPNIAANVDCETVRHPVGVCAGITPFNFPAMVPLWMFPVALACGNTFVLKPSEKVPLSAVRLGELLARMRHAGRRVQHRPRRQGMRGCPARRTRDIAAISFVGSTAVAKHVYEIGAKHGKRVQAAGGAKNHLIVMPDADLEQAAKAIQAAAFGCAGERCMAGSVAVPVGKIGEPLVELLCDKAAKMTVGPTDGGAAVDMGPVITREHRDRVAGYLDIGQAGRRQRWRSTAARPQAGDGFLIGPSVLDKVAPQMRVAKEEIFGPVLSVVRAGDLDEALALGRNVPYGNGASIFTRSGYAARQFKMHFNAGMIGINVGVPAPMAWFPFTGWNQSFFGDLHIQGVEGVHFYTRQKMTMTRWFASAQESAHDPIWKTKSAKPQAA